MFSTVTTSGFLCLLYGSFLLILTFVFQGGETFLLYVTVNDGHLTMKSEVLVRIKTAFGFKVSPPNKSSRPSYYPPYLLPSHPIVKPEIISPPVIVSTLGSTPKRKTDKHISTPTQQGKCMQFVPYELEIFSLIRDRDIIFLCTLFNLQK